MSAATTGRIVPLARWSASVVFAVCIALSFIDVAWPDSVLALERAGKLSIVTGIVGAMCCLLAAVSGRGRRRLAWLFLAVMLSCLVVGDSLWMVWSDGGAMLPFLSLADWVYLAAVPAATLALIAMPLARGWRETWVPLTFDAALLGAAALLVSAVTSLDEVIQRSGYTVETAVYLIYPVSDLLLVTLVAIALLRSVGQSRPDVILIGASIGVLAIADNSYALIGAQGGEVEGTWTCLAYAVAPALMGWAALSSTSRRFEMRNLQRLRRGTLVPALPDLFAVAALIIFVIDSDRGHPLPATLAAVVLVLGGTRQISVAFERQALRHGARCAQARERTRPSAIAAARSTASPCPREATSAPRLRPAAMAACASSTTEVAPGTIRASSPTRATTTRPCSVWICERNMDQPCFCLL